MGDPSLAFTLNIKLYKPEYDYGLQNIKKRAIVIRAYDDAPPDGPHHNRIDVEVRHGGKTVFPRGQLYCDLGTRHCTDSDNAKALVMSLVAMRPGDTDSDYFVDYTPDQLEWVEQHGEALSMEREMRYCDENGSVK